VRLVGEKNDALAFKCKVDGCARVQPDPVPEILWDHDLSLGADAMNHTIQV
jgi:hypothetical protein